MSAEMYIQSHEPQEAHTSITQVEIFDVFEVGLGVVKTGTYDECVDYIKKNGKKSI